MVAPAFSVEYKGFDVAEDADCDETSLKTAVDHPKLGGPYHGLVRQVFRRATAFYGQETVRAVSLALQ